MCSKMSNLNFENTEQQQKTIGPGLFFDSNSLDQVAQAADTSEELVNNYYKLSSSQWLKNRYDIQTAKDLSPHEMLEGPLAQVIKYEGRKKNLSLKSSSYYLYKICLQDRAILKAVEEQQFLLEPFLLYILTHELIHVVRFSKFKQRYENKNEIDVTNEEERKVHRLTYDILEPVPVPGLKQVFDFYKDWLYDISF